MTDPTRQEVTRMSDQPLDPATEERVRRLLAEARHDEPMPDHVAARMDNVLADLGAEPATRHKVVGLAGRRRRAGMLLAAAAAVVVVGAGVGELVRQPGSGSASSAGSARSAGGDALAPEQEPAPAASSPSDNPSGLDDGVTTSSGAASRKSLVKIRPRHFALDVRGAAPAVNGLAYAMRDQAAGDGCRLSSWGGGRYVGVTYAGSPGFLVFRHANGDTQVVDLYLCGSPYVLRSVTLPRS